MKLAIDIWDQAEDERESQRMEREFLEKWLPVWKQWGHVMPGCEKYEHLL